MDWLKFIRRILNNGEGMTVMEYLKTEIKPAIEGLREDHKNLGEKVASLPNRDEFNKTVDTIYKTMDTKIEKLKKEV